MRPIVSLCAVLALAACKDTPKPAAEAAPVAKPAAESAPVAKSAPESPAPTPADNPPPAPAENLAREGDDEKPTPTPAEDPAPEGDGEKPAPAEGQPAAAGGNAPGLDYPLVFAPEERMAAADCQALIDRELALIAESGSDEMKQAAAKSPPAEVLRECQLAPPPKVVAECVRGVADATAMYRQCFSLPFQGRPLAIVREFKANDPANAEAQPPMFSQHGDIIWTGKDCGLLLQKAEGFAGAFYLCEGKTTGPFTTNADIKQVFDALGAEQAQAHSMIMGIMANYPTGRTGMWRVCNSAGVCHDE